jgi:hypothetical protein
MNRKLFNLKKEVMLAYADCNREWEKGKNIRNLDYRSGQDVDKDAAIDIMTAALGADSPDEAGYNNFSPTLLKKLPDDSRIWLAREGSVCIYVATNVKIDELKLAKLLDVDEVDLKDNNRWVRIWWD